jgi:hypothetical protein
VVTDNTGKKNSLYMIRATYERDSPRTPGQWGSIHNCRIQKEPRVASPRPGNQIAITTASCSVIVFLPEFHARDTATAGILARNPESGRLIN